MASANACLSLAGRVRRFLSSIVCSCAPRSILWGRVRLPLCPTLNHHFPPVHPGLPLLGHVWCQAGNVAFPVLGGSGLSREDDAGLVGLDVGSDEAVGAVVVHEAAGL